jgi:hypothetical protein
VDWTPGAVKAGDPPPPEDDPVPAFGPEASPLPPFDEWPCVAVLPSLSTTAGPEAPAGRCALLVPGPSASLRK